MSRIVQPKYWIDLRCLAGKVTATHATRLSDGITISEVQSSSNWPAESSAGVCDTCVEIGIELVIEARGNRKFNDSEKRDSVGPFLTA